MGKRIREAREDAGLTLEAVAKALGVSPQAVQQWEQAGGTHPRRVRIEALANLLNTTPNWLEFGTLPRARSANAFYGVDLSERERELIAATRRNPEIGDAISALLNAPKRRRPHK